MSYFIGLDLGTTNCKAVAIDRDGQLLAMASAGYELLSPQPGWVEQDPGAVWKAALESLRSLASQRSGETAEGLCLSGAMHSLFPVDDKGAPLAPSMTWADQRSAPQATALQTQVDPQFIYTQTGCPLQSTYYPARLRWWQENAPDTLQQARFTLGIKDWILFLLTGVWACDLGMASSTGLLDIHRLDWNADALALSGLKAEQARGLLPPLIPPVAIAGGLQPEVAIQAGLPAGLPVVAGTTDGGLANLGSGAVLPGQTVVTVGTSGAVRRIVDAPWLDTRARTWCYLLAEGRWFAGGAINNAGLALEWVRERFYTGLPAAEGFARLLAEAESVPPGAQGLFLLPYFTGERSPHWKPAIHATFYGLGLEHGRAQAARAALEGVAYCLADVWQVLFEDHPPEAPTRLTGGITRSPLWVQILADMLGTPLSPLEAADASALGAAVMGVSALLGSDLDQEAQAVAQAAGLDSDVVVQPVSKVHEQYQELHAEFQDLGHQLYGERDR